MKRILLSFSLLLLTHFAFSQIPAGYYDSAVNKNGTNLRTALYHIIKGHTVLSYTPDLWDAFYTTDVKSNGKLWDMYSDNPGGTPPYEYELGDDQCGSYSSENDCYNREHLWPQSLFSSNYPMYSDLFLVIPTDGFVNGKRGNLPFGEVGTVSWTSMNGSKIGNNTYSGAPSGNCFEPIDEYKGDIARSIFYVATRYYSEDGSWNNWEMANGVELKSWVIEMLLKWHHADSVSDKERARNEAVYALQHNRNPFVDSPMMADCIYGFADCKSLSVSDAQLQSSFDVYPNPTKGKVNIDANENVLINDILLMDIQGKPVKSLKDLRQKKYAIDISSCPEGMYILKVSTDKGNMHYKIIK